MWNTVIRMQNTSAEHSYTSCVAVDTGHTQRTTRCMRCCRLSWRERISSANGEKASLGSMSLKSTSHSCTTNQVLYKIITCPSSNSTFWANILNQQTSLCQKLWDTNPIVVTLMCNSPRNLCRNLQEKQFHSNRLRCRKLGDRLPERWQLMGDGWGSGTAS